MTIASLLVELHTEELPPKALKSLSQAFAAGIEKGLRARGLVGADSQTSAFATPRRLAVHITQVAARSDDKPFKQKLMPLSVAQDKAKNWTAAFLKKLEGIGRGHLAGAAVGSTVGAAEVTVDGDDTLCVENDGKADAVYLQGVAAGQPLLAALQAALEEALAGLPIPKVMSYQLADGATTVQFVRPAHRLVALHGHAVVPVTALGLNAGTKTFGHRFHAPGELAIHSADTYAEQLASEGRVVVSFAERRQKIVEMVNAAAARLGATPIAPDDLLDEVTALVEWPVVYESGFEAEFLAVPPECLILTMQQNQKYFALQDTNGALMNRFLLVSNVDAKDPSAIIAGNARVVRARLADAKFFYDQDRRQPLDSRIAGLANVVYHNKLGSQLERVERVVGIAVAIARQLGADLGCDITHVERAARLAKADLRTLMVGEFPELQGIMGRYYAQHDREPADVADAIAQHYQPRFAGDALPASIVGTCVALADKFEALAGLFGIGEQPTGEKDPFGLRRQAIGVLRMLIEKDLPLDLPRLIDIAYAAFAGRVAKAHADLERFLVERLRTLLRDGGYSALEADAVLRVLPAQIRLVPKQLAAVRAFMQLPEAASLAAANKRIGNILKKAETGPGASNAGSNAGADAGFDTALLREPAEKALAAAFADVRRRADQLYGQGDYEAMLQALAPLKAPVDSFFDGVMVNVDDMKLRNNRLALLAALRSTMNRVADISVLAQG